MLDYVHITFSVKHTFIHKTNRMVTTQTSSGPSPKCTVLDLLTKWPGYWEWALKSYCTATLTPFSFFVATAVNRTEGVLVSALLSTA